MNDFISCSTKLLEFTASCCFAYLFAVLVVVVVRVTFQEPPLFISFPSLMDHRREVTSDCSPKCSLAFGCSVCRQIRNWGKQDTHIASAEQIICTTYCIYKAGISSYWEASKLQNMPLIQSNDNSPQRGLWNERMREYIFPLFLLWFTFVMSQIAKSDWLCGAMVSPYWIYEPYMIFLAHLSFKEFKAG